MSGPPWTGEGSLSPQTPLPTGVNYAARRGARDSGVGPEGACNTNSEGAQVPAPKNSAQGSPLGRLLGCTSMSPLLLADLFPRPAPGVGRASEKVAGAQDLELSSHLSTKPLCVRAHSLVPVSKPGPPSLPGCFRGANKDVLCPHRRVCVCKEQNGGPTEACGEFLGKSRAGVQPSPAAHCPRPSATLTLPPSAPQLSLEGPRVCNPSVPLWEAQGHPCGLPLYGRGPQMSGGLQRGIGMASLSLSAGGGRRLVTRGWTGRAEHLSGVRVL